MELICAHKNDYTLGCVYGWSCCGTERSGEEDELLDDEPVEEDVDDVLEFPELELLDLAAALG